MSSVQEFKCILCGNNFESKEELQIHFRKHGDPNFGQNKGKTKQSDGRSSTEKKEENEMVNCDVCSEVFPTISKAITHKHKVHPDHDAKYFCPWCGKLFTMKHLYNKHLQSVHPEDKSKEKFSFPCSSCDVEFLVASAMLYHNKFFHRQDTELPNIGHSKKVQTFGQEMLLLYYCPFCGEEFNNKMNLHKHMVEDHYDENQHPEDVLRCPLCDALFYHLDAYELHLTFHSIEDLYNEKNDLVSQITEFSLEAVPPLMEKIENAPEEDYLDPAGLAQMLQLGMADAADSGSEKKKRKKHKKSKKSAITLDEFLNMNQDVFGEGLDVQGIVEVPTQVVSNTLKRKQPVLNPGSKISTADMQKLKKQGVIIKMKSKIGQQPIKIQQQQVINKPVKLLNSNITLKAPNSPNAECNDVIAKLMNQSNSQIKIVKKTATNNQNEEVNTKDKPNQGEIDNKEIIESDNEAQKANLNKEKVELKESVLESSNEPSNAEENHKQLEKTDLNSPLDMLRKIGQHLTVKPVSTDKGDEKELTVERREKESNVLNDIKTNQITKHDEFETEKNLSDFDDNSFNDYEENEDDITKNDTENTISDLKTISKSVTVKSLAPKTCIENKVSPSFDGNVSEIDDEVHDEDMPLNELKNINKQISPISKKSAVAENVNTDDNYVEDDDIDMCDLHVNSDDKPLSAIKNLSKFITVKPVLTKSNKSTTELDAHTEKYSNIIQEKNTFDSHKKPSMLHNFNQNSSDHEISEEEFENSSATEKSDKFKNQRPVSKLKLAQNIHNTEEYSDSDTDGKITTSKNVAGTKTLDSIKRLSAQISIKQSSSDSSAPIAENKITESENDFDNACSSASGKPESTSHLEALKKLGSNITFKSNKPTVSKTEQNNEEIYKDIPYKKKDSPSHVEALKKLGSNITLKSNNLPSSSNAGAIVNYNSNISKSKPPVTNTLIHNKESMSKSITTKSISNNINKINTSTGTFERSITAKSFTTSKFSQETNFNKFSSKIVQKSSLHESNENSEIFNIDDSDDENTSNLQKKQQPPNQNKSNAVKSIKKNRPGPACSKIGNFKNIEMEIKKEMDKAKAEMQQSLKKLGHNITIKSKNSLNFPESPDNLSAPEEDWENEDDNSNDSKCNKVKITEITDDQANDEELQEGQNPTVDSPQHSDDEPNIKDDGSDFEDQINKATIKKPDSSTNNHSVNRLQNLSHNITVKSLKMNQNTNRSNHQVNTSQENKQNSGDTEENHTKQIVCRPPNKNVAQNFMPINRSNSVNKVTTSVKTYQTETVIEEVTTTVTKTIRTVNKTLNQEVSNANKTLSTNQIQNRTIQNIRPVMQPRNIVRPQVRPSTSYSRPRMKNIESSVSNQLVPIRPRFNVPRAVGPRMQTVKTAVSQQGLPRKNLKIAPNVNLNTTVKRQAVETVGPFSQFKKPKESLIPYDDIEHGDDSEQYASTSRNMETNFSSTKIVKGNSTVTQIKNKAMSMSSQQINKVGNVSGLKVMKSSQCQKSSYSEVTNEVTPEKQSTLDAIQKLQKQGLIIKKPRIEEDNAESEHSDSDET